MANSLNSGKSYSVARTIFQSRVPHSSSAFQSPPQATPGRTRGGFVPIVCQSNIDFLTQAQVPVTPLTTGHVALDINVYPMNNEKTRKEGVFRTYKGFDGYAPIALYLGKVSWCIGNELREGKQHCQYESGIRWSADCPPRDA
jgi:hypothetical protein